MSLEIHALPTEKQSIYQRPVMAQGIIPRHPNVCLFSGKSGSGKSNLMLSLLTRKEFYGSEEGKRHYFDHICVLGSTCESDDLYLGLKKQSVQVETVTEVTPESIQQILDYQKEKIAELGISSAPRTLIIYEDLQSHSFGKDSVMKSRPLFGDFHRQ